MEKSEPLCIARRNVKLCATAMENSMMAPKKMKRIIIIRFSNSTRYKIIEGRELNRYLYTNV